MFSEDTFKEVLTESSESVGVGDHNSADTVCFDEVQKGSKAFPLEVDSGGDVGDDSVVIGCRRFEGVDLSLEVSSFLLLVR